MPVPGFDVPGNYYDPDEEDPLRLERMMDQGARDANAESTSAAAQSEMKEMNQRLDTITALLFKVLEAMEKSPPQHLWPRQ